MRARLSRSGGKNRARRERHAHAGKDRVETRSDRQPDGHGESERQPYAAQKHAPAIIAIEFGNTAEGDRARDEDEDRERHRSIRIFEDVRRDLHRIERELVIRRRVADADGAGEVPQHEIPRQRDPSARRALDVGLVDDRPDREDLRQREDFFLRQERAEREHAGRDARLRTNASAASVENSVPSNDVRPLSQTIAMLMPWKLNAHTAVPASAAHEARPAARPSAKIERPHASPNRRLVSA